MNSCNRNGMTNEWNNKLKKITDLTNKIKKKIKQVKTRFQSQHNTVKQFFSD